MAVATTYDNDESILNAAQLVWFRSITTETAKWERWLRSPNLNSLDLFRKILDKSVFGKLLVSAREEPSWGYISADTFIHDPATTSKWGELEQLFSSQEMVHLLKNVSNESKQGVDESAMMIDE